MMEIKAEELQQWIDEQLKDLDTQIQDCTDTIFSTKSLFTERAIKTTMFGCICERELIEKLAKQFNLKCTERKEENYVRTKT